MMHDLVLLVSTFTLALMTCYASLSPAELYWNFMLPNTLMPKAIQDRLATGPVDDWGVNKIHPEFCLYYAFFPICLGATVKENDDPRRFLFFTENDLKLGTNNNLYLIKSSNHANFLPHKVVNMDPFTSKNITMTINLLLSNPVALEAKDMRNTIRMCGSSSKVGEENSCVTSLEEMIDFTTSRLGKDVYALISEADQEVKVKSYGVMDLKNMKNQNAVVCHKLTYPYAVYNCHSISNTRAYKVSLATADGRKINVAAVCHTNTSNWSPKHLAFDVLKVKPGTSPICHLVPEGHIVWVPNKISK